MPTRPVIAPAWEPASGPIRVGILGCGFAGGIHAALVSRTPGLELVAVVSPTEERRRSAQEKHGVRTYSSLESLLGSESIDLVVIATPNDTHAQLAVAALKAGCHVVCEKVMCLSLAEADRMIGAARDARRLLSVFHNRRWDGDFLTIRQALRSKRLGEVRFIEMAVYVHKTPRVPRQRSGGLFWDWGAHLVDQALLLFHERPTEISGWKQAFMPQVDTDSHVRCELFFPSGALCAMEVCYRARLSKPRWLVLGERGALRKDGFDPQEAALRTGRAPSVEAAECQAIVRDSTGGDDREWRLETTPGDWGAYYRGIVGALHHESEPPVPTTDARRVVGVLEQFERAAAERQRLRLELDE